MNNKTGETEEKKERSTMREVISMLLYIGVILALTYLIITYVGQRTQVSGMSMYPTLSDGDNLIVDKISYRFKDPQRYDIIVFPFQYKEKTYYIKRIIGLPGEEVQVIDGEVYINGEKLGEDYGREVMEEAGLAAEPIQLGEDEYFVLGDNRNNSEDSRYGDIGRVNKKYITGKLWFQISPMKDAGLLND